MAASLFQAVVSALSKTALISDDIPVAAANLIEVQVMSSDPAADPALIPSPRKGKPMSEGEFYRKAAGASLVPKALIALGLGGAAAGLGVVGLSGVLTLGLVPLSLWICGKSAAKEDIEITNSGKYKASWTEKMIKRTPGARKFLERLPPAHRHILGQTIEMDVMLEMEMMTLAAVALGASGLATAGIVGFCATVAIVPVVALAATAIVWSSAFGIRKFRNLIAKNEKKIESGARQNKPFDKFLSFVDNKIEPTIGIIGKLALMAIGGTLLINEALIPAVQMAIPQMSATLVPAIQSVIHVFKALPGIAQLPLSAPLGYIIGRFIYNPLIAPVMGAIIGLGGKVLSVFKEKEKPQAKVSPVAPAVDLAPARKIRMRGRLRAVFSKRNGQTTSPAQNTKGQQPGSACPGI